MQDRESGGGNKPPKGRAPTSDALRRAIDQGARSDKVRYPDPAAAPLGTDDEAAGTPPTPEQRRMAAAQELRPEPPAPARPGAAVLVVLAVLVALLGLLLLLTRPG